MGSREGAAALCGCCALLAFGGAAQADTKVVSMVEVQPAAQGPDQEPPEPRRTTVTSYFRGDRARVEVDGRPVILYDLKGGHVFSLDAEAKRYTDTVLKEFLKAAVGEPPKTTGQAPAPSLKASTKLKVKATDRADTVTGHSAKGYDLTASVHMELDMDDSGPGGMGGGMPGGGGRRGGMPGGGFPGGGGRGGGIPGGGPGGGGPGGGPGGGGRRPGGMGALPSIEVTGLVWLASDIAQPGSPENRLSLLPLYASALEGNSLGRALLKPLAEQVAKLKAFPVSMELKVTSSGFGGRRAGQGAPPPPQSDGNQRQGPRSDGGQGGQGGKEAGAKTVTVTWQVKSISQDGLDDALFAVPGDNEKATKGSVKR